MAPDALDAPSPFVLRHRDALSQAGRDGLALDLACGRGRHARLLAGWGLRVLGVDRSRKFLHALLAAGDDRAVTALCADAEDSRGLPLVAGCVRVLLVTRFLNRGCCDGWSQLLAPGGLLLYETFLDRQRELGSGPKRPEFLLSARELPRLFPTLEVLDYEEGLREAPQREWVASLLAKMPD